MTEDRLRILLIARHYPPLVSGGCRRASLMVGALRDAGADVSVIAPLSDGDPQTIAVAHPQAEADLGAVSPRPSLRGFIRTHFLYPDPDIRWSLRAAKHAVELWPEGFDWVITSSPPESIHAAGRKLSRAWGCKWMADFRDFWLLYPLYAPRKNKFRCAIERRIANIILKPVTLLTAVSKNMGDEIKDMSRKEVLFLPNFVETTQLSPIDLSDGFPKNGIHLLYSGAFSISDPGRLIGPTLDAFVRAEKVNPNLYLHIAGPLTALETSEIEASPARNKIKLYGRLPYADVRKMQAGAHGLLIAAAPGTVTVPGKLEEYQSTGRPIIAIGSGPWIEKTGFLGDPVSAMAELSADIKPVVVIPMHTQDQAGAKILEWMRSVS